LDELSQKMGGVSNYSPSPANCRWFSMTLLAFTHTIVVALPMISMPALLDENAHNLGLNLFKSDGSGALVSWPALSPCWSAALWAIGPAPR